MLDLPIDCTLGKNCFIEDYVDADPGSGQTDYTCGIKSRDGHRGVDFVLIDFETMEKGINVLASAPGIVAATRDGMPDQAVTDDTRSQIEGRECGNAVRIDHGDGWQTLYCHMAQGSVRVSTGDQVTTGDPLGLVGLSGLTNIPHVHLTVLKDDTHVDPFNPRASDTCGAASGNGLWQEAPEYDPTGLFTAGFSTAVPDFDDVKSGAARREAATGDQPIVLYAHAFHPKSGDQLRFSATGPEGEIFEEVFEIDEPKAQIFQAFGRRAPDGGWPHGAYRGHVILARDSRVLAARHADIIVTP